MTNSVDSVTLKWWIDHAKELEGECAYWKGVSEDSLADMKEAARHTNWESLENSIRCYEKTIMNGYKND